MAASKSSLESHVSIPEINTEEKILDEAYQTTYEKFNEVLPSLPKQEGWWFQQLAQYQGFWLPPMAVLGSMLINDHFKPRTSDIILSTSPKCGTTWLRALVYATINRKYYEFNDHPLLSANPQDLVPFFEAFIRRQGSYSHVEALSSPRFLSTHLPYSLFPKSMASDGSGCRFVYICRDPKDVLVSKWHFMTKLRSKEMLPISFGEVFERFANGISHYGPTWEHALGYWKASLDSPNNVLFLKYEDLKREPLVYVKKLGEFLGFPFSSEEEENGVVHEIVRLCSFQSLSNLEVNKSVKEPRGSNRPIGNSDFFRKGEVGDWMNHLTPQMIERLDRITKEKFHDAGFNFD